MVGFRTVRLSLLEQAFVGPNELKTGSNRPMGPNQDRTLREGNIAPRTHINGITANSPDQKKSTGLSFLSKFLQAPGFYFGPAMNPRGGGGFDGGQSVMREVEKDYSI